MPLISIIVPVYNTEQYLPRSIDSVLNQSFTDFEVLLVDDGSKDGSGKICDAYAEKDSRIRVFHKENGGVSSARNLGLDNATGEWVSFVDSDDELMPGGLQAMADGISDKVSMVMAGYNVFDDYGCLTYSINSLISCLMSPQQTVEEMFMPTDYRYQGYICSKLLRMAEIRNNKIRFSEAVFFNEDRLFLTQFICVLEDGVFYTTKPVYRYFEHQGSAMMSIKKSFNPKFVSDLEAQIIMRECVRARFENKELLKVADFSVYQSYRRIVGMMNEFHYNDRKLKFQLRSQLIKSVGIQSYTQFEISRNKRRVQNIINKLI